MTRPLSLEFAGAVYHLTSRSNARQTIFFNDGDRELFLQTLAHRTLLQLDLSCLLFDGESLLLAG